MFMMGVLAAIFRFLYRKGVFRQCVERCAHTDENANEDDYVTDGEISSGYDSDLSGTDDGLPWSESDLPSSEDECLNDG